MLTLVFLALASSPIPAQSISGTGVFSGGIEVPATLTFSNALSGASNVQLTYAQGAKWIGSDSGHRYVLSASVNRDGSVQRFGFKDGPIFESWRMGIVLLDENGNPGNAGSVGVSPDPKTQSPAWKLVGYGITVSP